MATGISIGKCKLCNATFSKKAMTKHLESCFQRKEAGEVSSASDKEKSKKMDVFHLVVEGRDLPDYWMHLSAPAYATLKDLDNFLRGIWLECCGHLSAFTIEGLFCDECAGGHECGEETILPVVNSPRVGVCGYTG